MKTKKNNTRKCVDKLYETWEKLNKGDFSEVSSLELDTKKAQDKKNIEEFMKLVSNIE